MDMWIVELPLHTKYIVLVLMGEAWPLFPDNTCIDSVHWGWDIDGTKFLPIPVTRSLHFADFKEPLRFL